MTGGLGGTPLSGTKATLKHYRQKVAADSRRLARPPRKRKTKS